MCHCMSISRHMDLVKASGESGKSVRRVRMDPWLYTLLGDLMQCTHVLEMSGGSLVWRTTLSATMVDEFRSPLSSMFRQREWNSLQAL